LAEKDKLIVDQEDLRTQFSEQEKVLKMMEQELLTTTRQELEL